MKRLFSILLLLVAAKAYGNNLQISNAKITGGHEMTFSVSWEHSWKLEGLKAPYNHDAAWIFVKYRKSGGAWQHLDLETDSTFFSSDSFRVEAAADGKGIFLSRKSSGSGKISGSVKLQWKSFFEPGNYDFRVFGIEMVWAPEGGFYLGDGASESTFRRGDAMKPLFISSEEGIALGKDSLSLNDTGKYAPVAAIPAAYPKGFAGFYCMKYEISQEQYVDFLNTLTFDQQKARVLSSPDAIAGTLAFGNAKQSRNGIAIMKSGASGMYPAVFGCDGNGNKFFNAEDDGQNRACNFLDCNDITAYLDWAALSPMTEMEFEKVCRGPGYPVKRAYAWGTDKATDANTLAADGTSTEHVTDTLPSGSGMASFGYDGPQGPLRCGFGGSDSSDRRSIGAAYYGALEMSGNIWETCVTVNTKGLSFDGSNGDGSISGKGEADESSWPPAEGAGYRGGAWNSGLQGEFNDLGVSDRFYAGLSPNLRRGSAGGRGCRRIK